MKGELVDKLGQVVATTAGVSFAAALTESINAGSAGIEASNNLGGVRIDSGDVDRATASAITDASTRIGQALLDRYEKIVPVVEILSGRDVAAVFARSTEVMIIEDDEESQYASLD